MKFSSIKNHFQSLIAFLQKDSLQRVYDRIVVIGLPLTYNFIHGFADYSKDAKPIIDWANWETIVKTSDTALFYFGDAAMFMFLFLSKAAKEESDFFRNAWMSFAGYFFMRCLYEIYCFIWGADINAKIISGTLFYVTLGIIFYLALSYRKEPATKTKVT